MSFAKLTRRGFTSAASSLLAATYIAPFTGLLIDEKASESQSTTPRSKKPIFVADLSRSPHVKLRPVSLTAVAIQDGFWGQRIAANRNAGIDEVYRQEALNGRIFNFQRMHHAEHDQLSTDLHSLRPGADSEVYKWLEGTGWALTTPDPELQRRVNQVVKDVVDAQEPSGYLDTYFVGERTTQRMLPETQIVGHEVYSMGHLIQAGIALYRVTGDSALLDAGLKFVNGYVLARFGPEPDKLPLMSGHPGPEMMLVELYRETRDAKYLELAAYLLQGDQRITVRTDQASYTFAGRPFIGRTVMEGHAVRAVYACCGAADYAIESGDPSYLRTLNLLWEDMTQRQMYITGGIGATVHNEAFGGDYALPNKGSYCESCANIGVFQWAYRMLALTGKAIYGDVLERVLYNSVNSGMSLDGLSFNYRNPLCYSPDTDPQVRRPFWYVNCCAPNLNRTLSSLQSYFYSLSREGVFVHLYHSSKVECNLADGTLLEIRQATTYPWGGNIDFAIEPTKSIEFTLFLRIPAWAGSSGVTVNGAPVELVTPGQYLPIRRTWSRGDRVRLNLDMTPRLIVADPNIEATRGRVAVQRGPLVYCMESIDQSKAASLDNFLLKLDTSGTPEFNEQFDHQLLGGVVSINMRGILDEARVPAEQKTTYSAMKATDASTPKPVTIKLIPYYTFANRQESAMQVWLPYTRG
jgi:uncharacterized protein